MNKPLQVLSCVFAIALSLNSGVARAEIHWWFDFAGSNPVNVPANKLAAITQAMDSAVDYYNAYADYSLSEYSNDGIGLRVIYDENVATANASYKGRIAFGGKINGWTAMHEMSHVFGVGTIFAWNLNRNTSTNLWTSPLAIAELEDIDGPGAVLHADSIHFWPYGLNVSDGDRRAHVRMVGALREDMGLSNRTYTFEDSDFNRDGFQDLADLQTFRDNWLKSNSGLGNFAYELGDRNQDGVNDLADWVLIRQDFMNSGGGPFLKAVSFGTSLPEPSSCVLALIFGTSVLMYRRQR